MRIRCWGSRGSIPVSGPEYLRYGGDTTCIEVRSSAGDVIVIDAGSGVRRCGEALAAEGVKDLDVLFTHAHLDHIMGFAFFVPIYTKGTRIRVHGSPVGNGSYRDIVGGIMRNPYCPVDLTDPEKILSDLSFDSVGPEPFQLGSLRVTSIPLSHPDGGLGFRFEESGASFVFLTDNELDYRHPGGKTADDYAAFCRGADLLVHDAEYTAKDYSRTWGHSVFDSAVRLGIRAGVKRLGLFHVNQRRTDDEMDAMVAESRKVIESEGPGLECFGVATGWEMRLG